MLLITKFGIDVDIIYVPQFIVDHAEDYQKHFFSWLFDKNVNHSYWWYKDGEKFGCSYRSDAFIEWLNAFPLKDSIEKAKSISVHAKEYDTTLSSLFF